MTDAGRKVLPPMGARSFKFDPDVELALKQACVWTKFRSFPIFINAEEYGMTRDELYAKMKADNVLGRRYFYPLISEFSTYRGCQGADRANLPNAHKMADSVICLPMHHVLSKDDINRILDLIIK